MTKKLRISNGDRKVSSKNGGGNIGELHAKIYDPTTILYHTQKLTQNGWDLNVRM